MTIAGTVEPGGPLDPDRIAQVYLALHQRRLHGPEVVVPAGTDAG